MKLQNSYKPLHSWEDVKSSTLITLFSLITVPMCGAQTFPFQPIDPVPSAEQFTLTIDPDAGSASLSGSSQMFEDNRGNLSANFVSFEPLTALFPNFVITNTDFNESIRIFDVGDLSHISTPVAVTGSIDFNGFAEGASVSISFFTDFANLEDEIFIVDFSFGPGTFSFDPAAAPDFFVFDGLMLNDENSGGRLIINVVPEPSVYALAMSGLIAGLLILRR